MKSKLIITLLSIFIFTGILSAQSERPFRFGVVGGMNLSNVKVDLDNRVGFHAGVKAEYALPLNFYLESGLLFTRKGFEMKYSFDKYNGYGYTGGYGYGTAYGDYEPEKINGKSKANKYMLELPIHVGYKLKLHNVVSVFGSAGGYLGYGIGGKYRGTITNITSEEVGIPDYDELQPSGPHITVGTRIGSEKIYEDEKRFDWGLGLKAGVELFDRLQISASYDWGMNKLYSDTSEGNNRNFMVSCAFMIF